MLRVLTSQTCFDRTNKSTGFTPFLCTFLWICLSYFITSMYSWYIDTRNQPGQPKYTIWFLPITTPKRCSILRTNPSRMVVNSTFSESLSSFLFLYWNSNKVILFLLNSREKIVVISRVVNPSDIVKKMLHYVTIPNFAIINRWTTS